MHVERLKQHKWRTDTTKGTFVKLEKFVNGLLDHLKYCFLLGFNLNVQVIHGSISHVLNNNVQLKWNGRELVCVFA